MITQDIKHLDELNDEFVKYAAIMAVSGVCIAFLNEKKLAGRQSVPEIAAILGWSDTLVEDCLKSVSPAAPLFAFLT